MLVWTSGRVFWLHTGAEVSVLRFEGLIWPSVEVYSRFEGLVAR